MPDNRSSMDSTPGRERDQQVDEPARRIGRHHPGRGRVVGSDDLDDRVVVAACTPGADPLLHLGGDALQCRPAPLVEEQHGLGFSRDGVVRAAARKGRRSGGGSRRPQPSSSAVRAST